MIDAKALESTTISTRPLFIKLQNLYGSLPTTHCQCQNPGGCCIFLPEMTGVEALLWIWIIQRMSASERIVTLRKFVEFYLTNPVRHVGCPFRTAEGACRIYQFRPFACRAYGLWSQKMGRFRTMESRKNKKTLRRHWRKFDIELPVHMVEFEMDYCDKVQIRLGISLEDAYLTDILRRINKLGMSLGRMQERFETEFHSDFSFLIASLVFGHRKAVLQKFAVIKELVQKGTDKRLQTAREKIASGYMGISA
jgi:Fe-S-cluster containining protein